MREHNANRYARDIAFTRWLFWGYLLILFAVIGLLLPSSTAVERSIVIDAPASEVIQRWQGATLLPIDQRPGGGLEHLLEHLLVERYLCEDALARMEAAGAPYTPGRMPVWDGGERQ